MELGEAGGRRGKMKVGSLSVVEVGEVRMGFKVVMSQRASGKTSSLKKQTRQTLSCSGLFLYPKCQLRKAFS